MAGPRNRSLSPRAAGLIAGALAFALYLATNHPQALAHDAAEFQTLAATGGIAHAGYPLVVLLLTLLGRLPLSTMAFRANLLSCLGGALAVGFAAYAAARLTRRPLGALAAALALALSLTLWSESTRAGVHAFTLALDAAIFLLALRFAERGGGRNALALGLLMGFGMVSHLTVLALVPALTGAVLMAARARRLRVAHLAPALLGLGLGLSPLAYLIAHDRPEQPMNYIESTLDLGSGQYFPAGARLTPAQRAAWLVSARQYLAHNTFWPFEGSGYRLRILLFDLLLNEFPIWGIPIALLGGWGLWRRHRREALLLVLWLAGTMFLLLLGAARGMVAIFFLPGAWLLSQLIAAGVVRIAGESRLREAVLAVLLVAAPLLRLAVAAPPAPLAGRPTVDLVWSMWPERWSPFRTDTSWEAFGRGVMGEIPPRAVLMSCWEEGMTLCYFRYAEPLRTDVDVKLTCWDPRRVRREIAAAGAAGREAFATFDPTLCGIPALEAEPRGSWARGRLWRVALAADGR